MYPYTIHTHACTANISVDRARAWTEENGRGRGVVAESNMGGLHSIKIWGIESMGGDRALMGEPTTRPDRQRINKSDKGEEKGQDAIMEAFP